MTPPRSAAKAPSPVEIENLAGECHQALILSILGGGPHPGDQLAPELEAILAALAWSVLASLTSRIESRQAAALLAT